MASIANAGLSLVADEGTFTLNSSEDIGNGGVYIVILADTLTTSIDADIDLTSAIVTYPGIPSGTWTELDSETGLSGGINETWSTSYVFAFDKYMNTDFSDTVTPIDPVVGNLITGINIVGSGSILVGFFSGGDLSLYNTQEVVLPEPITIGLLGLGGLFLRRRSK